MSAVSYLRVRGLKIEYSWFEPAHAAHGRPAIVMLHEGLGSVAMWKDFPLRLANATGARVVAYSRFGYGRSDSPARAHVALRMHEDEALGVLPGLLRQLGIESHLLFGHSDGASIALIYAGAHPEAVTGLVALAPHVFVEEMCLASIQRARETYRTGDWRHRLARYHVNPDGAFWGWNNVWLDPAFRAWNIERYLPSIRCPVLAIQGYQDEYGTMAQLECLERAVTHIGLLKLERCGHSPHRDRTQDVLASVQTFLTAGDASRDRCPVAAG